MKTGGPAFPVKGFQTRAGQGFVNIEAQGMTLRDYFAAKAMQGLIANGAVNPVDAAKAAYIVADAMLKAREQ